MNFCLRAEAAVTGPIYDIRDLHLARPGYELEVPELRLERGQVLLLAGESGSGKSTLLNLLAGCLAPDRAAVMRFAAVDLADLWARRQGDALARLRARAIGYVLQTGGLLPYLTVRANIALPAELAGRLDADHLAALAGRLGISHRLDVKPAALSVGERQRVAIARALAHRPAVLLADEPTAALDPPNADRVFALLLDLVDRTGATAIIASHDWQRLAATGRAMIRHEIGTEGPVVRARFWTEAA